MIIVFQGLRFELPDELPNRAISEAQTVEALASSGAPWPATAAALLAFLGAVLGSEQMGDVESAVDHRDLPALVALILGRYGLAEGER